MTQDKRDMAPMVWSYIKSRETARRMEAYAGEVQAMHPFYAYDSPARAKDMDLATTNAYAGPNHLTANIQHGSWSMPVEAGKAPQTSFLNSNQQPLYEELDYSNEDIKAVEEWVKVCFSFSPCLSLHRVQDRTNALHNSVT
jgi:alcohol oxidase